MEARRGVEPRSTILQTVLLPEQRAVGAGSGNRTRAVGLADRCSTFEPYLRGAESRNRTGLAALEAQSFALNKPRVGGRTRASLHGGRTTKHNVDPEPPAGIEPAPRRYQRRARPSSYRGNDLWSRRVPPPESLLARQTRGLPHNPVAGRLGIEPSEHGFGDRAPPRGQPIAALRRGVEPLSTA